MSLPQISIDSSFCSRCGFVSRYSVLAICLLGARCDSVKSHEPGTGGCFLWTPLAVQESIT